MINLWATYYFHYHTSNFFFKTFQYILIQNYHENWQTPSTLTSKQIINQLLFLGLLEAICLRGNNAPLRTIRSPPNEFKYPWSQCWKPDTYSPNNITQLGTVGYSKNPSRTWHLRAILFVTRPLTTFLLRATNRATA